MKPGEETPQNWQQPSQSPPQAPFQAPPDTPETPVAGQASSVPMVAQPSQQPVGTPIPPSQSTPPTSTAVQSIADLSSQLDTSAQTSAFPPLETTVPALTPQSVEYTEGKPLEEDETVTADTGDDVLLRWQATEYIHHERTAVWYVILGVVVVAFIALALLVFHSITFAILIPVMLVALVVYVRRPPSLLNYTLSRKGLHVNDHLYTYDQFKAFGVVSHEELHSVVLIPRKRFQVSQTIYFPEEVGESLVDMLAARLPMQEVHLDTIDRLLKKLRI